MPGDEAICVYDLLLLTLSGGIERNNEEIEGLLRESGFKLNRTVATRAAVRIIEAQKV